MNDFKTVKRNRNNNDIKTYQYQTKSKSGWTYHTHITPIDSELLYNPLNEAFNQFLNNLKLKKDDIYEKLEQKTPYRLIIRTSGTLDNISISGKTFQKSKFLINRKFKQKLIEYYNEIDIFVNGPNLLELNDRNIWVIELSPIYKKFN